MQVHDNTLGNPAAMELLQLHKPTYWFSGHLHVKVSALYNHTKYPIQQETPDPTPTDKPVPFPGSHDQGAEVSADVTAEGTATTEANPSALQGSEEVPANAASAGEKDANLTAKFD